MFSSNMGLTDRLLRAFFGLVLVSLSWPFLNVLPGAFLSYFCLVFGVINIISSIVSWCFMYKLIGISSCTKKNLNNNSKNN